MMDYALLLARIIHVLTGIFWVGAMLFVTAFLIPSIAEVGPDGGKVMAALTRRKFMVVMPVIGTLTILSGLWLYWRASAGFQVDYMKSGPGHAYAFGAIFAIAGYVVGMTVTRPAMMKAGALSQSAATASESDRPAILAQAQAARKRGATAGKIVAWLLGLAALTMAVGRYV
jgi:uncharacterized membrane protein